MKLADWLSTKKIKRREFAAAVGIGAPYLTELCQGIKWPGRDVAERIMRETKGKVTPTDFI